MANRKAIVKSVTWIETELNQAGELALFYTPASSAEHHARHLYLPQVSHSSQIWLCFTQSAIRLLPATWPIGFAWRARLQAATAAAASIPFLQMSHPSQVWLRFAKYHFSLQAL
jgi:hypothetical protein